MSLEEFLKIEIETHELRANREDLSDIAWAYNQGWVDACSSILERLKDTDTIKIEKIS